MMAMASKMLSGPTSRRDDSSQSEGEDREGAKVDRQFRGVERIRKRIKNGDRRLIGEFEASVKRELGVAPGQPWTLADKWDSIRWGRLRGLSRMYLQDVAVYEFLRQGRPDSALCQLVQNLKSKEQTALDNGSWEVSWHLTGLQDRTERSPFAGSHREMAAVASYRKAVKELKLKSQGDRPQLSSGGEEGDDPPQRVRDRRKKPAPKKPADAGAAAA